MNITAEFALGYLFGPVLESFGLLSLCGIGSVAYTQFVSDRNVGLAGSMLDQYDSNNVVALSGLLYEACGLGLFSETFPNVLFVITPIISACAVLCANLLALNARGISIYELIVMESSFIGLLLVIFEFASIIMRPVSISVRVFANLTSGALVSALLTPVVGVSGAGALVVDAGLCVDLLVGLYGVLFTAGFAFSETFIGAIQLYVFVVLATSYSSLARH